MVHLHYRRLEYRRSSFDYFLMSVTVPFNRRVYRSEPNFWSSHVEKSGPFFYNQFRIIFFIRWRCRLIDLFGQQKIYDARAFSLCEKKSAL
ncbi:hypothetical protein Glove_293g10 [Diversispora epigaea]|uniref:Uncharacterized protein n=1 Tax=Diversispora epigaea TaxID=1348612 RepID=A0A397HZX5_9GLOM|nr:hypothetical protein Glove_293g10 [Diversispora epigaea]